MRVLLPKEKGAYAQALFPLAAALSLTAPTPAALSAAGMALLGFFAHEPWLVLWGGRGKRAQAEHRSSAFAWLGLYSALGAATFAVFAVNASLDTWLALLPAALLSAVLLVVSARGKERTTTGELLAALALALWALPTALAENVPWKTAAMLCLTFALGFAMATVSVRALILGFKGQASLILKAASWFVPLGGLAALFAGLALGQVPLSVVLAVAPMSALSAVLSIQRPHPKHLRRVGYALLSATAASCLILTLGLR